MMPRAKGSGRQKRSQLPKRLRGRALPVRATSGAPVICAAFTAPALKRMRGPLGPSGRSEEHTSELQSLMRISYAVFCLQKKKNTNRNYRCVTTKQTNKNVHKK